MRNRGTKSQSGYSILEVLIVLVILIILVTFAVAQFGRSSENLERQNIAREFKVFLERARFDSVKRRASSCADMSRVEVTGPTAFRLISDQTNDGTVLKVDGTVDPSDVRPVDFANRSQISIVGDALVYPIIFRFDQRGNVSTGPCPIAAAAVPTVTFCNLPCTTTTADSSNSNIVFVSATGTAALMKGGETVPTFDDPDVTDVNVNANIDRRLTVWNGTPPTPTPFPTPTPSPTPSPLPPATPTPTPNPSVTPTPTPTPSPTPTACTYGQFPNHNPPCTCISPMKVLKKNGPCVGITATPTP